MTDRVRVSVLGATGSVGVSTLDVVCGRAAGAPEFDVVALAANTNVDALANAAIKSRAELAVIAEPSLHGRLKLLLDGTGIEAAAGVQAIAEAASRPVDVVVAAIVGIAGLPATLAAIQAGNNVALANKESMVCGGPLLRREAIRTGARLLPIDSEHNAIFQVLDRPERVEKLILTASGGPFRNASLQEMAAATPEQATAHPNWDMGAKISVDSATMMNKGLELIEAAYLFDLPEKTIDIIVHPQSIVHSLVHYRDGSVLAQMAAPDMRVPISYALAWPDRAELDTPRLEFATLGALTFEAPNLHIFPAPGLCRSALATGAAATTAISAANEIAVEAFLERRIGFLDICRVVEETLAALDRSGDWRIAKSPSSLDEVIAVDQAAREAARSIELKLTAA